MAFATPRSTENSVEETTEQAGWNEPSKQFEN